MEDNPEVKDRQNLFKAALEGNVDFFEVARSKEIENCDEEYFLRQTSSDKYNILHIAVQYRQNEFIKRVVEGLLPRAVTDKLIYQEDYYGNTPLHAAAEEDNLDFCKLLFEYEKVTQPVDWSVKNEDGNTPMHIAFIKSKVEVAEWLMDEHRELAALFNNDRNTPLHVAAALSVDSIFYLIADRNAQLKPMLRMKNEDGNTPLHVALINGNSEVARLLALMSMQSDDVARICNNLKETPLHLAIKHFSDLVEGKREDMKIPYRSWKRMDKKLMEIAVNCDVSSLIEERNKQIENGDHFLRQDNNGDNILHIAIRSKSSNQLEFIEQITEKLLPRSIIDKLIVQKNDDDNTPFHVAAELGNIDIFYEKGKYCGIKNANGNTPLHVALINGNVDLAIKIYWDIEEEDDDDDDYMMPTYIDVMYKLIEMLVDKESQVACWQDEEGLTPLHRSAFLYRNCSVKVIKHIIKSCSESARVADGKEGKTILHMMIDRIPSYKQGIELLKIQEIHALRNCTDKQGETPLHLAKKFNIKMVQALFNTSSPHNAHGLSTATHIQQIGDDFDQMKKKKKRTLEEYGVIDGANIQFLMDKASKYGMNFLVSRDSKGRNVLHNLMHLERRTPIVYDEYVDFVKQVLHSYPLLVCQTDFNGDTPIHILMQNSHDTMTHRRTTKSGKSSYILLTKSSICQELLDLCCKYFYVAKEVAMADAGKTEREGWHYKYGEPWLVHNMAGNTPLHEALIENHIMPLFSILFRKAHTIDFEKINKRKETLLHLLAGNISVEWSYEMVKAIMGLNEEAAFWQDQDGLTPIMRAAQVGHIQTVKNFDNLNKEASKIADNHGQTLWHKLMNQPPSKVKEFVKGIGERQHLIDLLQIQDKAGKTPLHMALKSRQFVNAFHLLNISPDDWSHTKKLLEIKDGDGNTSGDLLASVQDLPAELEDLLSKNPIKLMGYRSVQGISTVSTVEMKDYVNTMGVIAAILATLSFTAALTVPGGSFQDDKDAKNKHGKIEHVVGTPLLLQAAAFQAFMFFDISTMCLSTMVLFCLLWILATGSKKKSVILMDSSVLLLLISFHTTLLSFMTGVYATTFHIKPWITIYTLVMCSLLMLLMHKCLVITLLGPIGPIVTQLKRKITKTRAFQWCKDKVNKFICSSCASNSD